MITRQSTAAVPCIQQTESTSEKKVKMAKPRLCIPTQPNMSPRRPKLTTSTAVSTTKPRTSQSREKRFEGSRVADADPAEDVGERFQHDRGVQGGQQHPERGVGQDHRLVVT